MDQKKIGVILSYAGQFIHIITGFLYTPIMLRLLGQSEYGLYQIVYSVVSYLSLLSLGFGSSYMRFYSRAKEKGEIDEVSRVNGIFFLVFCFMALICILCGIVMLLNIEGIFGSGLTEAEYSKARILMFLMIVNLSLTFPNSVFDCIITSQERFIFQKTLSLFQYLLNPFITLPLLIAGYGSVSMVLVSTILTLLVLIINTFYSLKVIHAHFSFKHLKFELLKEMWVFTFFIFLNQIVDQINWSVDKFLLGRISGTISVALYSVGAQINSLYIQFSSSVSSVFVPKVNRLVAGTGNTKQISELFTRVGRIQFIIMSLILSGFVFFGKPFIKFWAGEGYEDAYVIALLLIVPVTVPLIQNLGIEIQRANNKHKARSVVYLVIALINVFISIPLIKKLGPCGAAIGTTISLTIGNILFMNWYYQKKLNIDIKNFWYNIAKFIPAFILPAIIGIIEANRRYDSVMALIRSIIIYSFVFCISMYLFGMNKEEKSIITNPLKRFFCK